jgi:glutaredoxin-related protein
MKVIELILDDTMELSGIDAISIVESPAIEEKFIALKQQQKEMHFAEVSKEKKIIMGALLIPDKQIYRNDEESGEYMIFFSKDTIRKCMEMFFKNGNQSNATFEHMERISGLTMVESWIVEDTEMDKSKLYNLDVPVGTWMGSIKVDNEMIWNEFIKTGVVKGFSIEGYFADKIQTPLSTTNALEDEILAGLDLLSIKQLIDGYKAKN